MEDGSRDGFKMEVVITLQAVNSAEVTMMLRRNLENEVGDSVADCWEEDVLMMGLCG